MDTEDKRRYLIVSSVMLEIVSPLLRKRLEDDYKSKGFACLQDFINSLPVKHMLFHLRHKTRCCVDKTHCFYISLLPLNYSQWKRLYAENPGPRGHHCHCKYTAKPISLNDLDITLATLILINCCTLTTHENTLISNLREYKNNYLSHNTDGAISEAEYNTIFSELTTYVMKLDPMKQDDLVIIQNRPLDQPLCDKYLTCLLDVHVILEKIDTKIDTTSAEIRTTIGKSNTEVMETVITKTAELLASMGIKNDVLMAKLEKLLQNVICQRCKRNIYDQDKQIRTLQPYKLGKSIFALHHQTDLTTVVGNDLREVNDILMVDDGRLVMCFHNKHKLLICSSDGLQMTGIPVRGSPWCITAVNSSTVAVILWGSEYIDMYDINTKRKLKSIPTQGRYFLRDIATINNMHVVCEDNTLLIIDLQSRELVKTVQTDCNPDRLQASGDRIFYCDHYSNHNKKLYWYSYTDDRHHTLTLPSPPREMTTLQDGSLYVVCMDESVNHVSSDGKQYKTVSIKGLKKMKYPWISYNSKQRKLVTIFDLTGKFNVFCEK